MIWFKSLLIGLAAAIVTAVAAAIALPVLMLQTAMWWADTGEGTGGIGVFFFGTELVLLPAIVAFALGVWWSIRRERRTRAVTSA